MSRDKRQKRSLHFLDQDGMVACNPRDCEAAHRAEMENIATGNAAAVTCRKSRAASRRLRGRPHSESRAGAKSP